MTGFRSVQSISRNTSEQKETLNTWVANWDVCAAISCNICTLKYLKYKQDGINEVQLKIHVFSWAVHDSD